MNKCLDDVEKNVVVVNTDDVDVGCGDVDSPPVAQPPRAGTQREPELYLPMKLLLLCQERDINSKLGPLYSELLKKLCLKFIQTEKTEHI